MPFMRCGESVTFQAGQEGAGRHNGPPVWVRYSPQMPNARGASEKNSPAPVWVISTEKFLSTEDKT